MLNWIVRNSTVWHLKFICLQDIFINLIFNISVKTKFGIDEPTIPDIL